MPVLITREKVTVNKDGVVEVQSSQLKRGMEVEVSVFLEEESTNRRLSDMIGSGKGCYSTPEEADEFISRERDQWELDQ